MIATHRILLPAAAGWITAAVLVSLPTAAAAVAIIGATATGACSILAILLTRREGRAARQHSVPGHGRGRGRGRGRGHGRGGWLALAAVGLLAVTLVATAVAAKADSRAPEPLTAAAEAGRTITVRLVVTEKSVFDDTRTHSPWDRADADEANADGAAQRIRGTIIELDAVYGRFSASVPALLFATVVAEHPVAIGSLVEAMALPRMTPPGDGAAVLLFADGAAKILDGAPWYLAWAADLRSDFVGAASALPGGGGELLPGLAVGDTSAVSDSLDTAMTASALSHLTAVSGANCAVIVAVLTALLAAIGAPRRIRIAGALAGLGLFVVLVTPEPSVVRAALMALSVLLASAAGRPGAGLPVLSLVVLIVVIADPWLSRSYGFVLSALATAGLLTLARPLGRLLATVMPRWLAAAFAIPLAAQLACQPVLILLTPTLPVLGVPANLLAAPAAPLATLAGLLACLLVPIVRPIADLILWLGWVPATWIASIATTVQNFPLSAMPWLPGVAGALLLAALTAVLISGILARQAGHKMLAIGCTATLVLAAGGWAGTLAAERFAPVLSMPADWSVAACDVGQGDAIVVRDGDAFGLIDTGAEPTLLTDCLDRLGIQRLDLLVLTHFDLDHVGGVAAVIGRAALVLTGEPQDDADTRILSELEAAGATVRPVVAGDTGTLGSSRWLALWPPRRAGDRWVGNAASVTLLVEPEPGGIRSLFLGDLGEDAQDRVLAGHRLGGQVDLVKVAHHGSADQSRRMYLAASARIGLVSVGADNDYGHPTQAAIQMLAAADTTVLRTDTCGLTVVGGTAANPVVWTERQC